MSDDIVNRLLTNRPNYDDNIAAAEEVERLRAEANTMHLAAELLRVERDALRGLLRRAWEWIVEGKRDFNDDLADAIYAALNKENT